MAAATAVEGNPLQFLLPVSDILTFLMNWFVLKLPIRSPNKTYFFGMVKTFLTLFCCYTRLIKKVFSEQ